MNIGEGGALLLVERDGDAKALLLGVGESSDAHHMSSPHPEGLGARLAMVSALDQAGVDCSQIDYINAHGTGTLLNDAVEAQAISAVFGNEVPVSSTKGFTGHMLAAAGATELVFTILAIETGRIPANLGAEPVDPSVPIRINAQRSACRCQIAMSTSFGFGGSNVAVIVGAA
jgi:3-oxoacyl-[acyl-carrier-protein] synthase-1